MTRVGNQIPTQSVILPYTESYGDEARQLYDMSGFTCQEWQALMLNDIMAVNDDGLWIHQKFGYSVPRRNGKSEMALARCIWGLKNNELSKSIRLAACRELLPRIRCRTGYAGPV